ncbi:MAG: ribbon-helix-helix domain-containing protein [Pseudomonadota bacterium]
MASTPVKRLNATLPEPLARFVGEITGEGGLYETPSEFVRDLIRRYMEKTETNEQREINALLTQAIEENEYVDYNPNFAQELIDSLNK